MLNNEISDKGVRAYGESKLDNISLFNGDCLEVMDYLISKNIKVDAIIADPPYGWIGTTNCKWDQVIPFDPMWKQISRIIKDNGAIVLFSGQPFTDFALKESQMIQLLDEF